MTDELGPPPPPANCEVDPAAEAFYSGAIGRIVRLMPVLGGIGTVATLIRFGWIYAAGFLLGAAIANLNFYWLKRVVGALGELVEGDRSGVARAALLRFLLRYGVIIVAAYAILKLSERALFGMIAGLFLPVAAILCEAAYEVYTALRRGL